MSQRPWTKSAARRGGQLIKMARAEFGKLSKAELWMCFHAATGQFADCNFNRDEDPVPKPDDPDIKQRTIRAECLSWLCTEPQARECIHHKGVLVHGAFVQREVNLLFAEADMHLALVRCALPGGMNLMSAAVRSLHLNGSHVGVVIGDELRTKGTVCLDSLVSQGGFRLPGADIDGDLDCEGASFADAEENGRALMADGLRTRGNLIFRGVQSRGTIRFIAGDIGGEFSLDGATLASAGKDNKALTAQGLKVAGSVFIQDGFSATGLLDFTDATVQSGFIVKAVAEWEKQDISLHAASIGTLRFDKDSWPPQGRLFLDGLTYDRFDHKDDVRPDERIDWVRLHPQSKGNFHPQPYEQLALVLARGGHAEEAKKALIAKAWAYLRHTPMNPLRWLLYAFFGLFVCFGYKPWRAFLILLCMLGFGWWVFQSGYDSQAMVPQEPVRLHGPPFNSFIYSLDLGIPLVNLHQEENWTPVRTAQETVRLTFTSVDMPCDCLRYYAWVHIVVGWVLTTLFVVGLTGLVRGDPSRT